MALQIDLHDLSFNTGVADANGATWWVTDLQGWEAPNMRQQFQNPTSRRGSLLLESELGDRTLVLAGICKAPTESAFWASYNGLLGKINNLVVPRTLKVYETVPKQIPVVRTGLPRLKFQGVGSFAFEISLTAQDPLKITSTAKTGALGASTVLTNDGNYNTDPIITLGSAGTVFLTNSTQSAYATLKTGLNQSLPSGTVINFRDRTVKVGSTNYYSALDPTSVWWDLKSGANTILSTGSATLTYSFNDAWL